MITIDNTRETIRCDSIGTVPAVENRLHLLLHLRRDVLVKEGIVWGDADLPSVEEFSKKNPSGRDLDVCTGQHECGRLATQFQCDWREVFCSRPRDNPSHGTIACVTDVVPVEFQQVRGLVHTTSDDGNGISVEILLNERLDEFLSVHRDLRRLHDTTVPSSEGVQQGVEGQGNGEVPRTDRKEHTLWFSDNERLCWLVQQRCTNLLRLHPSCEVLHDVLNV
mmetsp:Transcript_21797/g.57775  ORF Transcript_21797/g.57775 Transcript_21797/m.57775 type:complete len:222 (+) Transcript_21797:790-1455(+)